MKYMDIYFYEMKFLKENDKLKEAIKICNQ